jgi:error-prone DNA polymerase
MSAAPYAELQAATHFSFLRGASSPEELFAAAALLGLPALGITDRNSLAGVVKAHAAPRSPASVWYSAAAWTFVRGSASSFTRPTRRLIRG